MCYMPFHIYVSLSLLLLSVSLSLIVFFLISCHPISPYFHSLTHSMHFSMYSHFFLLIHILPPLFLFLIYPALLSCTFHRSLYQCRSGYKSISGHKLLKPEDVYSQSPDALYTCLYQVVKCEVDRYLTFPGNFTWLIIAGNLKAANNHYFIMGKKISHYK